MAYPNGVNKYVATLNVKGLLQADPLKRVVRKKLAFGAAQNYAALFHHFREKQPANTASVNAKNVLVNSYRDSEGKLNIIYWDGSKNPANTNKVSNCTLTVNAELDSPVVVDILTGNIYSIPAQNIKVANGKTIITKLPFYDSPMVVM